MSDYYTRSGRPSRTVTFLQQTFPFGVVGSYLMLGSTNAFFSAISNVKTLVLPLASNMLVGKGADQISSASEFWNYRT
jgi:hypothetical protein